MGLARRVYIPPAPQSMPGIVYGVAHFDRADKCWRVEFDRGVTAHRLMTLSEVPHVEGELAQLDQRATYNVKCSVVGSSAALVSVLRIASEHE